MDGRPGHGIVAIVHRHGPGSTSASQRTLKRPPGQPSDKKGKHHEQHHSDDPSQLRGSRQRGRRARHHRKRRPGRRRLHRGGRRGDRSRHACQPLAVRGRSRLADRARARGRGPDRRRRHLRHRDRGRRPGRHLDRQVRRQERPVCGRGGVPGGGLPHVHRRRGGHHQQPLGPRPRRDRDRHPGLPARGLPPQPGPLQPAPHQGLRGALRPVPAGRHRRAGRGLHGRARDARGLLPARRAHHHGPLRLQVLPGHHHLPRPRHGAV